MRFSGKWVGAFGKISLAVAFAALVTGFSGKLPEHIEPDSWLFSSLLMAVVSAVMIIAARLQAAGNPLADKMIPSSLVAYLLFILMVARWLTE